MTQKLLGSTDKCFFCGHPMTAHTGTAATVPYRVCARCGPGGCKILEPVEVEDILSGPNAPESGCSGDCGSCGGC